MTCGVFLRQRLDLRLADVLARQVDMLVERHALAFPSVSMPAPAQSPFWTGRTLMARAERPKETRKSEDTGSRAPAPCRALRGGLPFSLRPERVTAASYTQISGRQAQRFSPGRQQAAQVPCVTVAATAHYDQPLRPAP